MADKPSTSELKSEFPKSIKKEHEEEANENGWSRILPFRSYQPFISIAPPFVNYQFAKKDYKYFDIMIHEELWSNGRKRAGFKRLNLNSDLGEFYSVFHKHLVKYTQAISADQAAQLIQLMLDQDLLNELAENGVEVEWSEDPRQFMVQLFTVIATPYNLYQSYTKYKNTARMLKNDADDWTKKTIMYGEINRFHATSLGALFSRLSPYSDEKAIRRAFKDLDRYIHLERLHKETREKKVIDMMNRRIRRIFEDQFGVEPPSESRLNW